jgi:5S rRNA maturation endonuclease (ribonuclease M5)
MNNSQHTEEIKPEGDPIDQAETVSNTFEHRGFKQTEYLYPTAAGKPHLRVMRTDRGGGIKDLSQEHWALTGWQLGLGGLPRVVYNLPAVARSQNKVIWLVEGEKCADALIGLGAVATTTSGGAGRKHFDLQELEPLHGKTVYMLPDNDAMGRVYRDTMIEQLAGKSRFHVIELPGLAEKEDVIEWLEIHGGTKEKLLKLAREATPVAPPKSETEDPDPFDIGSGCAAHDDPMPDETRREDVERALDYWNYDVYNDWWEVGMSLFNYPDGKEIWMRWAAKSEKFNRAEAEKKWKQLRPTRGKTVRSLFSRVPPSERSQWGREHAKKERERRQQQGGQEQARHGAFQGQHDDWDDAAGHKDSGGQQEGGQKEGAKAERPKPGGWIEPTPFVWIPPENIPPRQWLFARHLVRGFVSGTIAPGGRGKSTLITAEAVDMATGGKALGIATEPLCVWSYNGEDPKDELQRKVTATMLHYNITPDMLGGRLFIDSGHDQPVVIARESRDGNVILVPVVDNLIEVIRQRKVDVLQLDPFVSLHQVSENDNSRIDAVVKAFCKVASVTNCAIELVHHSRKTQGPEQHTLTADDARGASSLIGAARSVRLLNGAAAEHAAILAPPGEHFDPRRFFSLSNGKSNLAPQSERSTWFRIAGVALGNGDEVGVAEGVTPVGTFDGVTEAHLTQVEFRLSQMPDGMAENVQAGDWIGLLVAEVTGLPVEEKGDKERIKRIVKTWIENGVLVVKDAVNSKSRRHQRRVFMGASK